MIQTITIDTLSSIHSDDDVTIVDTRPIEAFNGWRLGREVRGGHLRGAVAFPGTWAARTYDGHLAQSLAAKGITPDRSIVVYGTGDGAAAEFAERLHVLGFPRVSILAGGIAGLAARADLDVDRLPGFSKLVPTWWLDRLLRGEEVDEQPAGDVAVFHVNYGVPEEYATGHIPGAFHLDTNVLESSTDWNRRPVHELEKALAELGITSDTTVIVYGRDTAADPSEQKPGRRAGQIAATRAAAILLYSGVRDVRLLDGGFNRWLAVGYGVETVVRTPVGAPEFGVSIPARPGYFIDFDEAVDLIADPAGVLVSIRSKAEFEGRTSGYNYIRELGDIPGAVWGDCGTDAYHMQVYRNPDNTIRDFTEIAATWAEIGITPEKHVSFYCGTGWRASETFFYAHLMGWPQVSIYDGGWFEWSRRAEDAAA